MNRKQTIYYELLVLRCQRGQADAFQDLARTWDKRLFYYIRRLIDDEQDAWQILQEIWLKVLAGIKKLRQPRKLLEVEYRLAELAENIQNQRHEQPSTQNHR